VRTDKLVYFSQAMMSYQENTTKQPIECRVLQPITQKQIGIMINIETGYKNING